MLNDLWQHATGDLRYQRFIVSRVNDAPRFIVPSVGSYDGGKSAENRIEDPSGITHSNDAK